MILFFCYLNCKVFIIIIVKYVIFFIMDLYVEIYVVLIVEMDVVQIMEIVMIVLRVCLDVNVMRCVVLGVCLVVIKLLDIVFVNKDGKKINVLVSSIILYLVFFIFKIK